ncbi:DUF4389 domain-containing protein [Candidatus Thioglobus sp.]|jgi:hypothetical protein|nr:DUF4389 domain-containing protein [Candidatus Thioglobus sp.]
MKQYPVNLKIDYPEKSNKLTAVFRLVLIIPIVIILSFISSYAEALSLAVVLMILFREKYPKWWFDWNLALTKFWLRIAAYGLLMRDEYPSTETDQAVQVELPYPDVNKDLNRWMPLVKWFLAIPHFIALVFMFIAVVFCTIFAWFAILFTGRYPRGIFDFVEGFLRWSLRVNAYAFLLTTDQYPPFKLF